MATATLPDIEFLPPPDAPARADGPETRSEVRSESEQAAAPAVNAEPADVRRLTQEEIERDVAPVFAANGAALPNPAVSTFVGAVRDGKVIGFLCLQAVLHAEPMYINTGDSGVFMRIVSEAERVVLEQCGPTNVFLFAPAGRTTQLAQLCGMKLEPWCVLSKAVAPTEGTLTGGVH